MSSHITARVTRSVIATAAVAICCGTVTIPCIAMATGPAVAVAVASPTSGTVHPDDNPWG
jgi:hypothetical protein